MINLIIIRKKQEKSLLSGVRDQSRQRKKPSLIVREPSRHWNPLFSVSTPDFAYYSDADGCKKKAVRTQISPGSVKPFVPCSVHPKRSPSCPKGKTTRGLWSAHIGWGWGGEKLQMRGGRGQEEGGGTWGEGSKQKEERRRRGKKLPVVCRANQITRWFQERI